MTWMQTYSGQAFDLLHPDPRAVRFTDLGISLSRCNRFIGHTAHDVPYSVAQHSYLAEQALPADASPGVRLLTILHDAHEAFIGDIPSPVKMALRAAHPRAIEAVKLLANRVQDAVHRAFGLHPWEWEPGDAMAAIAAVKHADMLMLAAEKRDLMAPCDRAWDALPDPEAVPKIDPLASNAACYVWSVRTRMLIREAGVIPLPTLGWL